MLRFRRPSSITGILRPRKRNWWRTSLSLWKQLTARTKKWRWALCWPFICQCYLFTHPCVFYIIEPFRFSVAWTNFRGWHMVMFKLLICPCVRVCVGGGGGGGSAKSPKLATHSIRYLFCTIFCTNLALISRTLFRDFFFFLTLLEVRFQGQKVIWGQRIRSSGQVSVNLYQDLVLIEQVRFNYVQTWISRCTSGEPVTLWRTWRS